MTTTAKTLEQSSEQLMEKIVDPDNLVKAWTKVRSNGGAPGPDGITIAEFPAHCREHWPVVKQQLLEGTYQPSPARRKSIPKPDGSERHLGIPNVMDRVIQQAVLQILTPIFDPGFSESSFGFRPKRSAQDAAKQVQRYIRAGYRHCIDMDLSKFFDRVQHDVLMVRVARKVRDPRLLKLIGRYLRAGVMVERELQPSIEGTMQGGPLSPLLANILLDDFDKELEHRGLHFVRYADDFLVFTKSGEAAARVAVSIENYLTRKLKLVINHQKSRVCRTEGVALKKKMERARLRFRRLGRSDSSQPEERTQVPGSYEGDHSTQSGSLHEASISGTASLLSGLGGLLSSGPDQDVFCGTRQVGPSSHPVVLLEAMARPANSNRESSPARGERRRSRDSRLQSQRSVDDVLQPGGA
jgi:group II intron reverse transcriptase/maturase